MIVVLLVAAGTIRGKVRAPVCEGGRFLVPMADGGLITDGATTPDAVVLDADHLGIDSGCDPVRVTLHASRKGTSVKAKWPSCRDLRKVRLTARFDASCDTLRGTLHARKRKPQRFVVVRSRCDDDVLDTVGGEECNEVAPCLDGSPCAACRCSGAGATTTLPAATTTSTSTPTSSTSRTVTTTSTTTTSTTSSTSTSTSTMPPGTTTSTTTVVTTTVATTETSTSILTTSTTTSTLTETPPPDPSTVAPPPEGGVVTDFADATAFLYTAGIQTGVSPGTIDVRRVAVLRGRVTARDGTPLDGVRVTVLDHAELGQTLSRADGRYDLGVNGGGPMVVRYQKSGLLPAERRLDVPWRDFVVVPDVALVPLDSEVTTIDLTAAVPMQVARGSETNDGDGTRRATLLIPQGTHAEVLQPDGSTRAVSTLNIRVTEYTVGPRGPSAMPATLPPNSGYTYAVELSVDESVAAPARTCCSIGRSSTTWRTSSTSPSAWRCPWATTTATGGPGCRRQRARRRGARHRGWSGERGHGR